MRFGTFYQRTILCYIGFGRTTTSTNDVYQSFINVFLDLSSHNFGSLVVLSQTVRKSGIRISADVIRSTRSQLTQERLQLLGSKRAVQSNGENRCMLNGCQEGFQCLTGQGASTGIGNGNGQHQRNFPTRLLHGLASRIDSRLGIQCIEDGFNQNCIYPAFEQSIHLLLVSLNQFIERNGTESRVIHIRTHRTGLVGRPNGTCYKSGFIGVLACIFIGQFAGQLSSSQVYFPAIGFYPIIGHRNALCIERIGFDDIGSSLQILTMNVLNNMRSSKAQQIVISLHLSRHIRKASTTEILLRQVVSLYHGSDSTVQYQDTVSDQFRYSSHNQYLNMRSISRRSSFSFKDWRLSYCFLPLANAITNLARPFSLIYKRVGTIVNPGFFSAS